MDLLTQLDTSLDLLLQIMSSSIAYISRKAKHQQLPSSSVPLTILGKTEAIEQDEMDQAIQELVTDLVEKAQAIKQIISHLPTKESLGSDDDLAHNLGQIQSELNQVNKEYKAAVEEAGALQSQVADLLRIVEERYRQNRGWLISELQSQPTHGSDAE